MVGDKLPALNYDFPESEIVFAFVVQLGTPAEPVITEFSTQLRKIGYDPVNIRLSEFFSTLSIEDENGKKIKLENSPEDLRVSTRMDAGDALRRGTKRGEILTLLSIRKIIIEQRKGENESKPLPRTAYVLWSLKHPDEVYTLRKIYGDGFFLIAIHSPRKYRLVNFATLIASSCGESMDSVRKDEYLGRAELLIERDEGHADEFGQRVRDTFQLADAFVRFPQNEEQNKRFTYTLKRVVRLLTGNISSSLKDKYNDPDAISSTPEREEYCMFQAYASSLRSGSLSRQVGAVIASDRGEVLALGCNDVPRPGGGLYWESDEDDDRDITQERDSTAIYQEKIIYELLETLKKEQWLNTNVTAEQMKMALERKRIMNLVEFMRAAHGEMDAITKAARLGIPIKNTILYCTTFPCHECAKLIIASGIQKVIYIEPYEKSEALELHKQAIEHEISDDDSISKQSGSTPTNKVKFMPFEGIGPRRYLDIFSMVTAAGTRLRRKDKLSGKRIIWNVKHAEYRTPLLPTSYLDRERQAMLVVNELIKDKETK